MESLKAAKSTLKSLPRGIAALAATCATALNAAETTLDYGLKPEVRGQAILRELVETNRYWLLAPPASVSNYSYSFHSLRTPVSDESVFLARVENPSATARTRRQGIVYCSLLQHLARDPGSVQIRGITAQNGQVVLDVSIGSSGVQQTNSGMYVAPDQWPLGLARNEQRSFAGQCGMALSANSSAGWFAYESTGGTLTIDAAKMIPLKSVSRLLGGQGAVEETFSDFCQTGCGHLAPLAVKIKLGSVEFDMKFKAHPGGVWLFDRGYSRGEQVAFTDGVAINRPPINLIALIQLLAKSAAMKANYEQAQTALFQEKDSIKAKKALSELESQIRPAAAFLNGTHFEASVAAGLKQLGELQKALDAGDIQSGRKLFGQLSRLGHNVSCQLLALAPAPAQEPETHVLRSDHVEIYYAGIREAYAKAIARTLTVARAAALKQFNFDMPDLITVTARSEPPAKPELFNDGNNRITLNMPSEDWLEGASRSGFCNIYGLCHEVGHIAMHRLLRACWLSGDADEGWAHYFGSRVTDVVFAQCGSELWPDAYDYRAEGMRRLEQQLADSSTDEPSDKQAAGQWKALTEIIGDLGVSPLFKAWGQAEIDPGDSFPRVLKTLNNRTEAARLVSWWTNAAPALLHQPRKGSSNP